MQKINSITPTSDENGEFTNGVVAAGKVPTNLDAAWFNTIQRELVNVVEGFGLALDPSNFGQLLEAINMAASGAVNIALPKGDIRLMPFRISELPFGWYFANGDKFLLTSVQGQALNDFSSSFKTDWQITITTQGGQSYINLPNHFHSSGRSYFERPVNGIGRQVGSIEDDAIRNITGALDGAIEIMNSSGAYRAGNYAPYTPDTNPAKYGNHGLSFDASRVVPVAVENRVLNIGKTPAIYLGV